MREKSWSQIKHALMRKYYPDMHNKYGNMTSSHANRGLRREGLFWT